MEFDQKNIAEKIDSFLKFISLMSVIGIGLGFIDLNHYYRKFGLSIWKYLELQDVLMSLINQIVAISFAASVIPLFWLFENSWRLFSNHKTPFLKYYSFIFPSLICLDFGWILFSYNQIGLSFFTNFFIPVVILLMIRTIIETFFYQSVLLNYFAFICLIIIYEAASMRRNNIQFEDTENGVHKIRVELQLKDLVNNEKVFKTNDSIRYFGSTKNYYFFKRYGLKDTTNSIPTVIIIPERNVLQANIETSQF